MKVKLLLSDKQGCGFYRMEEPARVCAEQGLADVEAGIEFTVKATPTPMGIVETVGEGPELDGIDLIVIQRPGMGRMVKFAEQFQRKGVAVAVELDDDVSRLDPNHPNKFAWDGKIDPDVHWRNLRKICGFADLVICTTQALADRFAPHGRYAVLENCVPEALLSMPKKSNGRTLGWTGAIQSHVGDLDVTHGGVAEALRRNPDWRFLKLGGGPEMVQRGLGLDRRPDATGPIPFEAYHPEIGLLDVGIAPLAPTAFNEAKSWLKIIEYGAFGIPSVVSPMPEYLALAEEGMALVAKDRGRNWCSAVRSLMEDESLRIEVGECAKQNVKDHHTYEGNAWRWAEAWEQAIENRRAA